jgi:hypothetical protein
MAKKRGKKRDQKRGPAATQTGSTEKTSSLQSGGATDTSRRITAVRHGRSETDQSITTQRPTVRGKYGATKFENNSKIFRN